jgi:hypothetical protein
MPKHLSEFTINNPDNNVNVLGYNDRDFYFWNAWDIDVSSNDCYSYQKKIKSGTTTIVNNQLADSSGNVYPASENYKFALCKNRDLYSSFIQLNGYNPLANSESGTIMFSPAGVPSGSPSRSPAALEIYVNNDYNYIGNDVAVSDIRQQYNFNVITLINLILGVFILLLFIIFLYQTSKTSPTISKKITASTPAEIPT